MLGSGWVAPTAPAGGSGGGSRLAMSPAYSNPVQDEGAGQTDCENFAGPRGFLGPAGRFRRGMGVGTMSDAGTWRRPETAATGKTRGRLPSRSGGRGESP